MQETKRAIKSELSEIRCMKCGKFLAKLKGEIEVKCPRCGTYNAVSN